MESLIKEMQDPENGVPVRSQKLFLSVIPSAFTGKSVIVSVRFHMREKDGNNIQVFYSYSLKKYERSDFKDKSRI